MAEILVVDDDQSVATAFERFLRHEGHTCLLASNAEDALRLVDERRPPLAFMDVRMPGIDGLQALKTMRGQYPDVFVVIMTAHGTSQTSIDAMRLRVRDQAARSRRAACGHRPRVVGEVRRAGAGGVTSSRRARR
jgi:DNA-binding NtrC family response regulator